MVPILFFPSLVKYFAVIVWETFVIYFFPPLTIHPSLSPLVYSLLYSGERIYTGQMFSQQVQYFLPAPTKGSYLTFKLEDCS